MQLFVDVCVFWRLSFLFQNCLKNAVPQYFFNQNIKCLIISSEKKQVPHYFFRKKLSASLFLQKKKKLIFIRRNNEALDCLFEEIMRHLIFSEEIMRHLIFSEEIMRCLIFFVKDDGCWNHFILKVVLFN